MTVYLVMKAINADEPKMRSICNKIFENRNEAVKYFNECIRKIRIDVYEEDKDQGCLLEDGLFELKDSKLNYKALLILDEIKK